MGLILDWLQPDKEKQPALSQSLISGGLAMLAGGKQDFGTSLAQGVGAGVKTYAEKFDEARKKALAMAPYKAAMTPAKPAVPAVYKAGGASLPQLGQAQDVAQNMYNLPQAANPYKPPEQDMTGEALGMPASLMPQGMGIEDFSGGQPGQIEEVAAQPAQAGGLDRQKLIEGVIAAGPEHPFFMKANEMMMEQRKPIVLGKSLIDPSTNKVIATDETWREEKDIARQQRMDEIKMRLDDSRLSREMQVDLRRELAGEQAALRRELAGQQNAYQREALDIRRDTLAQGNKPPPGYRYTPTGDLETIPGGPADQKAVAQGAAATDLDITLTALRDSYDRLDKNYGITSTENNTAANIGASLSSTGVGQTVGKMFGTKNQSARNEIAMTRPALLSAIMRATGMSSKQLDSNAELKLWLTTATDPTLDVESNRKALNNIEMKYLKNAQPKDVNQLPKINKQDGQTATSKSGKPIVLRNGRWEYQ